MGEAASRDRHIMGEERKQINYAVDCVNALCCPCKDFGRGFYTTELSERPYFLVNEIGELNVKKESARNRFFFHQHTVSVGERRYCENS